MPDELSLSAPSMQASADNNVACCWVHLVLQALRVARDSKAVSGRLMNDFAGYYSTVHFQYGVLL